MRRPTRDEELDEEIRGHLAMAVRDRVARGDDPRDAEAAARREFGNVGLVREVTRATWGRTWLDELARDARHAVRLMRQAPAFTAVVVLTLALGIGANTAMFTIVHAVMLEPLPFRDPGRLVVLWEDSVVHPGRANTVAPANYLRWVERATAFERTAAMYDFRAALSGQGAPEELVVQVVTPSFFPTLGIGPALGRVFDAGEGSGADRVAVLSHDLWQRRFGGDRHIVGRVMQLGGRPTTIVGVMPRDIRLFLKAGSQVGKPADLWLPLQFDAGDRTPRGRYLTAIGRLASGVSLERARSEMATIARGLTTEFPAFDTGWTVRLVPLQAELSGEIRPALLVLAGAVGLVLLIACANVANLLLARGAARKHEFAVRVALGAGRGRIVRQVLTETSVLALGAGLLGLLVAHWSIGLLVALSPVDIAGLVDVRMNRAVLAFASVVSLVTIGLCGLATALDSSRSDADAALKEAGRQASLASRGRFRHGLVVSEIALVTVLLVGAGLLVRSFITVRQLAPGFDSQRVLTMRVALPSATYRDAEPRLRFFRDAVAGVAALPGVRTVGVVSALPFAGLGAATDFTIDGRPTPAPGEGWVVDVRVCDNGYFTAMRIPLVSGRLFTAEEARKPAHVVVVNEALARHYFPGEDALGQRLLIDMADPIVPTTIVGVVGDVRHADLMTAPRAMAYWPPPELPYSAMTLTIRTQSDPLALAPAVARQIQLIDRDQPVSDVRTMDQWIGRSLARARFSGIVLTTFAAFALLLASLGIYGVMAYAVSQRTAEMGIRLALGATRQDILRLVVGKGLWLALAGLGLGVPLALVFTRALGALLYGLKEHDLPTFACAVGLLGAVAVLASYLPARRASRTDPVQALRQG